MKLPSSLTKGLSDEQVSQLERELKSSILARVLRKELRDRIANTEIKEEQLASQIADVAVQLGERRGFRTVLNLLPDS